MKSAINRMRSLMVYQVVFRLIATIFCSLVITFFIFRVYYGELDLEHFTWLFQPERNRIFLVSWLVIFLINLILLGVLQSAIVASGSLAIVTTVWLFINQVKMASRQTPFLPEDVFLIDEARQVSSVISSRDLGLLMSALMLIIMMMVSGLILTHLLAKFPKTPHRTRLALGCFVIIIGGFGLNQIASQVKNPTTMLTKDNLIGNELIAWNQQLNFYWNGPVIGLMYNIGKAQLAKPDNYSEQQIRQIVERHNRQAQIHNTTRLEPSHQPVNIALVLSESLVDPSRLTSYYPLSANPTPWLTQALIHNPSGQLATSEYGGGTANVEFEILTGLSTTFNQNTTPFTNFLPKITAFPSFATSLKQAQFQTVALHNFQPEMYKRHLTYRNLGIDKFYGIEGFTHRSTIDHNPYDSDYSFYQQLLDELQAEPTKAKFINGVTMQNHAPYDNYYQTTTHFAQRGDLNNDQYQKLETYLTGLSHTDQALDDFYQKLQTLPQKNSGSDLWRSLPWL